MFEKEAKEFERIKHYRYEDNEYCGDIADGVIQAYQQGAEFGYNKCNEQLIKAKEIIKKLYSHVFSWNGFMKINDYNVLKAEAEQFLNSEVEK